MPHTRHEPRGAGEPNLAFLNRAIELAAENVRSAEGGPFGAVIACGAEIIAEGSNRVTSWLDPTAHAEIVAIREACRKLGCFHLEGCEIYASCEPCPMCLGAIYWARLDRVFFAATRKDAAAAGFLDEDLYVELERQPQDRRIPAVRLHSEAAMLPFELWKGSERKVEY